MMCKETRCLLYLDLNDPFIEVSLGVQLARVFRCSLRSNPNSDKCMCGKDCLYRLVYENAIMALVEGTIDDEQQQQ
eukprot:6142825-Amphidinium_carterae.1